MTKINITLNFNLQWTAELLEAVEILLAYIGAGWYVGVLDGMLAYIGAGI